MTNPDDIAAAPCNRCGLAYLEGRVCSGSGYSLPCNDPVLVASDIAAARQAEGANPLSIPPREPEPFRAGQWVVCVDAADSKALVLGKRYEVNQVSKQGERAELFIAALGWYWASRFAPAEVAAAEAKTCGALSLNREHVCTRDPGHAGTHEDDDYTWHEVASPAPPESAAIAELREAVSEIAETQMEAARAYAKQHRRLDALETQLRAMTAAEPPAVKPDLTTEPVKDGERLLRLEPTSRGFLRADFTDVNGEPCSLQESSAAQEALLWLGCNRNHPPHHVDQAEMSPRMHLSQQLCAELWPLLRGFAETGELGASEDLRSHVEHVMQRVEAIGSGTAAGDAFDDHHWMVGDQARWQGIVYTVTGMFWGERPRLRLGVEDMAPMDDCELVEAFDARARNAEQQLATMTARAEAAENELGGAMVKAERLRTADREQALAQERFEAKSVRIEMARALEMIDEDQGRIATCATLDEMVDAALSLRAERDKLAAAYEQRGTDLQTARADLDRYAEAAEVARDAAKAQAAELERRSKTETRAYEVADEVRDRYAALVEAAGEVVAPLAQRTMSQGAAATALRKALDALDQPASAEGAELPAGWRRDEVHYRRDDGARVLRLSFREWEGRGPEHVPGDFSWLVHKPLALEAMRAVDAAYPRKDEAEPATDAAMACVRLHSPIWCAVKMDSGDSYETECGLTYVRETARVEWRVPDCPRCRPATNAMTALYVAQQLTRDDEPNSVIVGLVERYAQQQVTLALSRGHDRAGWKEVLDLRKQVKELEDELALTEEDESGAWAKANAENDEHIAAIADRDRTIADLRANAGSAAADAVQERKHMLAGMAVQANDPDDARFFRRMSDELKRIERELREGAKP